MNIIYLAGGYPSSDNPTHGVFNKRAVEAIKGHVQLTLIHYRLYKPGRKIFSAAVKDGLTHVVLCVPFFPFYQKQFYRFTAFMFRFATEHYCRDYLKRADLVHASDGNLGVYIAPLKKKYSFKLLVQFIGGDINQDIVPHQKKPWLISRLNVVDAYTFNSESLRTRFSQLFGLKKQTHIIYRGVDTKTFKPVFHLNDTHLTFYFLGGMPNYHNFKHGRNTKGGRTLMSAWSKVEDLGMVKKIRLLYGGPDSKISEVVHWKEKLKYPDRVEIIGAVEPDGVEVLHQRAQVVLIPSLEEGLPNVCLEAMASGNLVIASEVGGIPELIIDGTNGVLIKPGDPVALANAIEEAISSPEMVQKYGKRARSVVEKKFKSEEFGIKYSNLYKQLIVE